MSDLVYADIAGGQTDGPLVEPLTPAQLTWILATNPGGILQHVNGALVTALGRLPEGARVELIITGWRDATGSSWASRVAEAIQSAYARGKFVDPDTGQPVEAWPEHPGQIAWGDAQSDTVTLRSVKNAMPAFVFWIVIGGLGIAAAWFLWGWMRSAQWIAKHAQPKAGSPPPPPGPPGSGVLDWISDHWQAVAIGAGVLIATPFVISQAAAIRRASRDLREGDR